MGQGELGDSKPTPDDFPDESIPHPRDYAVVLGDNAAPVTPYSWVQQTDS